MFLVLMRALGIVMNSQMKKLITLLFVVMLTTATFAQTERFTTSHYSFTPLPSISWSEWYPAEILVTINAIEKHIVIYSSEIQIIDYQTLVKKEYLDCDVYGAYATDSDYGLIFLSIYFFKSGELQLEIQYNDVAYKYLFKE